MCLFSNLVQRFTESPEAIDNSNIYDISSNDMNLLGNTVGMNEETVKIFTEKHDGDNLV